MGIPGVILGLAALRLPESVVRVAKESMSLRELLRVPAFLALLVSGFFCSFAGYSYVVWGPDLVQEKGFSAAQASMALGLTIVLGGMLGIATGAYLSDLLATLRAWDERRSFRSALCWGLRQFILRCMPAKKFISCCSSVWGHFS